MTKTSVDVSAPNTKKEHRLFAGASHPVCRHGRITVWGDFFTLLIVFMAISLCSFGLQPMLSFKNRAAQSGFSLVEVLVSIVVLALGVIGAAGMQLTALRTSQQSAFQTAALELAAEIADKMRSNRSPMARPGHDMFVGVDYITTSEPRSPGMLCHGAVVDCDAEQLAHFDIYEWEKRLKTTLPVARAVICRDSAPASGKESGYKWECDGSPTAPIVVKIGWLGKNPDGSLVRDDGGRFLPSIALAIEPYAG